MSFDPSSLILAVSSTLKTELIRILSVDEADIKFESPSEIDSMPDSGLALFLYKLSENSSLKNQDYNMDIYSNPAMLRNPPLALDLHYLVIPFGNAETRQVTLARIMQFFHDNPIFNSSLIPAFSPILESSRNTEPKIVLKELSIEQINNIWSIFPNVPYRIFLCYMITPLLIPSSSTTGVPRVLSKNTGYHISSEFNTQGRSQ